jgi:DnaD/phage-associated family protein
MTDQPLPTHPFKGFPSGVTTMTELPEAFFTDLLPAIDNLAELKVTLYAFWYIQQLDGEIRFMKLSELRKDAVLHQAVELMDNPGMFNEILDSALVKAVNRGTFILIDEPGRDRYYFINTPRSQTIVDGYRKGQWKPWALDQNPVGLDLARPDIFKLYEQNIGLITPLISDQLRSAEAEFPPEWIADAIRIAVENNVRRWSYISRILASWQERGRNGKN